MKIVADFVNIFDDHGALMLEIEEAMNLAKYVQKKGTHKAPVVKKTKAMEVGCKGKATAATCKGKGKKGKSNVPSKPPPQGYR